MFEEVISKIEINKNKKVAQGMGNPISASYKPAKNDFLDKLTQRAVTIFEKNCDIKKTYRICRSRNFPPS